jgi:hypothetical protein
VSKPSVSVARGSAERIGPTIIAASARPDPANPAHVAWYLAHYRVFCAIGRLRTGTTAGSCACEFRFRAASGSGSASRRTDRSRSITCSRSEAFAPEVSRHRKQNKADADLPPDHGIRPRCSIDEPGASAERVPDGSGHDSAANAVALNASQSGLHGRLPELLYKNHHHVTTPATTTPTAISCSMTSNSTAPRTSSGASRLE